MSDSGSAGAGERDGSGVDADEPLLDVRDLHVYYGKSHAVKGVSLSVNEGEVVGVIGPNGAGKTTTLEAIAGFVDAEGTIRFEGTDLAPVTPRERVRRGLVYCTEERDLFPFFSVHENLRMGAQFRNDREAVAADLERVYDMFPRLDDRRSQEAETMSGGEQQMLAVGRALMGDPDLLLLDEPTLGLAPVIIEDLSAVLETLVDDGLTVLLVEQNMAFALEHADRILLLENGRIERSGDAMELRDDEYVRDAYIGSSER